MPSVVAWYERLFFNVVDRLDATDWIMLKAIGTKSLIEPTESDLDVVLKLLGYFGGPLVLDAAIKYLLVDQDEATGTVSNDDHQLADRVGRLARVMTIPIDEDAIPALSEVVGEIVTPAQEAAAKQTLHEMDSDDTSSALDALTTQIAAAFTSVDESADAEQVIEMLRCFQGLE